MSSAESPGRLPLAGLRVVEYAQYVAGPFAGMLLADLGADVIKVEPPDGDAWRRYEPFAPGESRYFYGLNRNKRSVVIDLKTEDGVRASTSLIRSCDAVLHNSPPDRALRFGLDRAAVRECNPDAVWCCVSALGSDGPQSSLTAFDLVAQAMSGLLLAGAQEHDSPPQRAGGIAIADFTAGLLAAIAVLAGLVRRSRTTAPGIEVSLLGAALAVQAQRFVSVDGLDPVPPRDPLDRLAPATEADLAALPRRAPRCRRAGAVLPQLSRPRRILRPRLPARAPAACRGRDPRPRRSLGRQPAGASGESGRARATGRAR